MRLVGSIFVSVSLFIDETSAALHLSTSYRSAGDQTWQIRTLLFALVSSAPVQLTLIFIHRDLIRHRPFALLLHVLQLGPMLRCLEVFCIYGSVGKGEEPYVSITRLKQMPQGGPPEEAEHQVGQAEGKLVVHRAAFSRASVIQAFLGSAPQLTLQLYICMPQRGLSAGRGMLMVISLLSIVYGALRCNILAIKIKYDDYEVDVRPAAYLCSFLWHTFEMATRVTVLVFFRSVLRAWVVLVVLTNFMAFSSYFWVLFWRSRCPFPENIEKTLTRVGTTTLLGLLTFLYAGINMFCWSAVQLQLSDLDLISKSQIRFHMAAYYAVCFSENTVLLLLWFGFQTEVYRVACAPLLLLHLLAGYVVAIIFMLIFYQFYHPCMKLFASSNSWDIPGFPPFLCLPRGPRLCEESTLATSALWKRTTYMTL